MKNKIALAAAFMAATSYSTAEIVINDFLSFEGFVDMSYAQGQLDFDGSNNVAPGLTPDANESENSYQVDQVEISWLFDFDPVTAQIDLAYEGSDNARTGAGADGGEVEQAFATYHLDNGSAITAGRYASMLGFEAFEPTGLYQYTFAYNMHVATGLGVGISALPGYAQGVKYTHETDTTFFGISLQDSAYSLLQPNRANRLGGDDTSTYAVEIAGSIAMDNGLSFFLGGVYEDGEIDPGAGADVDADTYTINAYTTFETGAWIFAAEVNYSDSDAARVISGLTGAINGLTPAPATIGGAAFATDEEILQGMLMANFAYSDNASVTGRITYSDHEADTSAAFSPAAGSVGLDATFLKYTLAHGYAFTDNLFLVTELSYVDGEYEANSAAADLDYDISGLQAGVELIFSF